MKKLIIDTSVAVKWFVADENDATKALELREKLLNKECVAIIPDLLVYELANALRYNPYFTTEDVLAAVNSIFLMNLKIAMINEQTTAKSVDLAYRFNVTVYDSYFLALSEIENSPLITADEKFYNKAKNHKKIIRLKDLKI